MHRIPPGVGWVIAFYVIFAVPLLLQGAAGGWGLLINGYSVGGSMLVAAAGLALGKRWGWYVAEWIAALAVIIWGNVFAQQLTIAPHDVGTTVARICLFAAAAGFLLRRQISSHFAVKSRLRTMTFLVFASVAFAAIATLVELGRAA